MEEIRDERYGSTLGEKKITILRMAVDAVRLAKTFVDDVQFFTPKTQGAPIRRTCSRCWKL